MVNQQIVTENIKRRVDLEARRQRKLAKVQKAMWADHAECIRMGYDWAARRAIWESELTELQAMRPFRSEPRLAPIRTPTPRAGSGLAKGKLGNNDIYAQALSKLDMLEDGDLPATDLDSDEEAATNWYKVSTHHLTKTVARMVGRLHASILRGAAHLFTCSCTETFAVRVCHNSENCYADVGRMMCAAAVGLSAMSSLLT